MSYSLDPFFFLCCSKICGEMELLQCNANASCLVLCLSKGKRIAAQYNWELFPVHLKVQKISHIMHMGDKLKSSVSICHYRHLQ